MCGILAVMQRDGAPIDPELVARMRDTMAHRGPDDVGLRSDGVVALAHRRLSILDLTASGHQPMCNEDGTIWIVLNGEIYNYVELTADLIRRGHQFRSRSDTETIIHLYEEYGVGCLDHLVGMFGFVLWDARKQQLFAARDRIGIKPVYYHETPERLTCASEMKALVDDPAVARRVDHRAMADFLFAGQYLGGKTPFEGVRELPPAHYLLATRERTTLARYWDLEFDYHERSWDDTVAEVRSLLDDAVRIHCRSDVPLGCHLSGGLDSSTVTSFAVRHCQGMPAFAIRFEGNGKQYDETRYAKAVCAASGTRYLEATPGPEDFWRLLASLVWHMDTPLFGIGAFSYYTVSRLASRFVKVTLTGHGGDEIFAGYPAQFAATFGTTAMFDRLVSGHRPAAPLARLTRLLRERGVRGVYGALARRLRNLARGPETLEEVWVGLHCNVLDRSNYETGFVRGLGGYSPLEEYLAPFRRARTTETLDRCLYHDLVSYLPSLLHQEDRVSMSLSVESRVPLLDHRLVQLLATVPPALKARNREPKALLRAAARGTVTDQVLDRRDKVPFSVPIQPWLEGPLWPRIRELLESRVARDRGIFRHPAGGIRPDTPDLWNRLNIEVWHRIFIDQDPAWTAMIGAAREGAGRGVETGSASASGVVRDPPRSKRRAHLEEEAGAGGGRGRLHHEGRPHRLDQLAADLEPEPGT